MAMVKKKSIPRPPTIKTLGFVTSDSDPVILLIRCGRRKKEYVYVQVAVDELRAEQQEAQKGKKQSTLNKGVLERSEKEIPYRI